MGNAKRRKQLDPSFGSGVKVEHFRNKELKPLMVPAGCLFENIFHSNSLIGIPHAKHLLFPVGENLVCRLLDENNQCICMILRAEGDYILTLVKNGKFNRQSNNESDA